jgi:hypothetical protein
MKYTTHLELHSQTTRLVERASHGGDHRARTGFSPSVTSCSKELRPGPHPKHLLQITTRTPRGPDFKFELLPLHSPLLRQSLLVSFPPLIDMLKFSGYPYLIRGQPREFGFWQVTAGHWSERCTTLRARRHRHCLWGRPQRAGPNTKQSLRVEMTLEQACPAEYHRAQCAFKDSMTH